MINFICETSLRDYVGRRSFAVLTPIQAKTAVAIVCVALSQASHANDILGLSIEQLLEVKVTSASRYEQKSSDVAASPQIIGADEIRASGARNLTEILDLFGGVNVHNDGVYSRIGVRGFLRTGDYNARVLLLINGRRFNELAYDGAYLGEEGPIDVSIIERVEFIPGPGSSVYGGNALFGVINVITKKPDSMPIASVAVEASDLRRSRIEAGLARKFGDAGAGMLQVSRFQGAGRQRDATELGEALAPGKSATRDREWTNRLYAQVDSGAFTASAVYVNREINVANGAYFNAAEIGPQPNRDRTASGDLAYTKELSPSLSLSAHLAASEYAFYSYSVVRNADDSLVANNQSAKVRWIDSDVKLVSQWRQDVKLVAGIELTRVPRLEFLVDSPTDKTVNVDERNHYTRWGLYVQNDWAPTPWISLSLGVRLDGQSGRDSVVSPRLGGIFHLAEDTVIKLQHGAAFRNPNSYELYYNAPDLGYRTNPSLREERVTSNELTFEHEFGRGASLRVTAFKNEIKNLIDFNVDPTDGVLVFDNVGSALVKGIQADAQLALGAGWRARVGATVQRGTTSDSSGESTLRNSPKQLAHVALFLPRWRSISGSFIWHFVGKQTGRDTTFGGYGLLNATLLVDPVLSGWSATLGVKNLLNRKYEYPLGDEFLQTGERGGAREWWMGARYKF